MVGSDPRSDESERGGQGVEHVHPEARGQQVFRRVEPRRPGTDDDGAVHGRSRTGMDSRPYPIELAVRTAGPSGTYSGA